MKRSIQYRSLTPVLGGMLLALSFLGIFQHTAFAQADPATATVNVAHFAPFGADVDSTSVTVKVMGEGVDAALENVKFGDIAKGVSLPAGVELTVQIIPTGTDTVAIEAAVTLEAGVAYTVAAIGGANGWELTLLPLVDTTTPADTGALVRIGHLAPFADAGTAGSTAVDICTDAGVAILEGVEFPQVTDYLALPAGEYDLLIALAGTDCAGVALDLPALALGDGDIVDVFAIGLLPDDVQFPLQATSTTGLPLAANVLITESFAVTDVDEDGTPNQIACYWLTLDLQPDGPVTINIEADDQVTLDKTSVTLDETNWNSLERTVQFNRVCVLPVDDGLNEAGDEVCAPMSDTIFGQATEDKQVCGDHLGFVTHSVDANSAAPYDGSGVGFMNTNGPDLDDNQASVDVLVRDRMAASPATVNVAHFAPFGADVDGTSVTVKVMGEGVDAMLENVKFGDIAQDVSLPSGIELTIQIIPTGTDTVAIEGKATLEPNGAYTVAAIGGANGWELELLPLVDETTPADSGALVRIGHLAPFADANTPGSTAVDICTDAGTAILSGVEYKQVTDYLPLESGVYDLLIALAGTDCAGVALDLPALTLDDGDIVDVFAIGLLPDDPNFPLQVASTTGFTPVPPPATVNVAHFAPFGADVDGTSVTVKVMGEGVDAMLENVKFGDIAQDVSLPSGIELTIQIIPTGTDTVAIEGKATLEPNGAYTVAAIGGANGWELELLPLVDETTPADSGALVRIGHLAPFADANTPGSTAVDICTDAGTAILSGVEYKQVTDYLPLESGVYDLLIALAGTDCAGVALDLPALTLDDGDIVDVFAIGLLPDDPNFPLQVATFAAVMQNSYYLPIISAGP